MVSIKKSIVIVFFGISPLLGLGQQLPLYSNYILNPLVYNPAHTGYSNELQMFLHERVQWTNFKGAPATHLFTIGGPLQKINSGIGLSFYNDQRGLFNTTAGSIKYAYHVKLKTRSKLSFGLSADIQNRTINTGNSIVQDAEDPIVMRGLISETFFDGSFGVEYRFSNKLLLGLSVPQIVQGEDTRTNTGVNNSRYYIAQASYFLDIAKGGDIKVQPVVLVKYQENTPFQYDANALFYYKDKFWIGGGYRSDFAAAIHVGASIKNVKVAYAYDYALANSTINKGINHEITLGYVLNLDRREKIIENISKNEDPTSIVDDLSPEKLRQILTILIDEYFELSKSEKPEDKVEAEKLKETIYKLLPHVKGMSLE